MATATNDKPIRLGDLPVVKTNILENAREFDKGVVGGYSGVFPLSTASKGGIYLLPSTGKFYVCETAYDGSNLSAPNSNFVELSVWKNHDRLSTLFKNKWVDLPVGIGSAQVPQLEGYLLFNIVFYPVGGSSKLNSAIWTSTSIDYNISEYKFSANIIYIKNGVLL